MNCPNCKQPMVLIKLLIHDVWHCRECEKKPKAQNNSVEDGANPLWITNANPWRTIQECFVDAGSTCPFKIERSGSTQKKFTLSQIDNRPQCGTQRIIGVILATVFLVR